MLRGYFMNLRSLYRNQDGIYISLKESYTEKLKRLKHKMIHDLPRSHNDIWRIGWKTGYYSWSLNIVYDIYPQKQVEFKVYWITLMVFFLIFKQQYLLY